MDRETYPRKWGLGPRAVQKKHLISVNTIINNYFQGWEIRFTWKTNTINSIGMDDVLCF